MTSCSDHSAYKAANGRWGNQPRLQHFCHLALCIYEKLRPSQRFSGCKWWVEQATKIKIILQFGTLYLWQVTAITTLFRLQVLGGASHQDHKKLQLSTFYLWKVEAITALFKLQLEGGQATKITIILQLSTLHLWKVATIRALFSQQMEGGASHRGHNNSAT